MNQVTQYPSTTPTDCIEIKALSECQLPALQVLTPSIGLLEPGTGRVEAHAFLWIIFTDEVLAGDYVRVDFKRCSSLVVMMNTRYTVLFLIHCPSLIVPSSGILCSNEWGGCYRFSFVMLCWSPCSKVNAIIERSSRGIADFFFPLCP